MMYVLLGASLGFSAGITPGPLNALIVSTTILNGWQSGLRVAVAPLMTDLPIIILSVSLVATIPDVFALILQCLGGAYLIFLAWRSYQLTGDNDLQEPELRIEGGQKDFLRGALVNLANPSPYIFWTSVGAPIIIEAFASNSSNAVGFVLAFYGVLVAVLFSQTLFLWYLLQNNLVVKSAIGNKRLSSAVLSIAGAILLARSVPDLFSKLCHFHF